MDLPALRRKNDTMKSITLYADRAGKIRWRMKVNGRILASPEGFQSKAGAVNNLCAIYSVLFRAADIYGNLGSDKWLLKRNLTQLTVTPRK